MLKKMRFIFISFVIILVSGGWSSVYKNNEELLDNEFYCSYNDYSNYDSVDKIENVLFRGNASGFSVALYGQEFVLLSADDKTDIVKYDENLRWEFKTSGMSYTGGTFVKEFINYVSKNNACPENIDYVFDNNPNLGINKANIYLQKNNSDKSFTLTSYSSFLGASNPDEKPSFEEKKESDLNIDEFYLCDKDGVKQAFQIIGSVIFILKVIIPLILIVLGTIDFAKAILSDDEKNVPETIIKFIKRIVIAVVIFVIPTILNFFFSLVDGASEVGLKYKQCTDCLFDPFNKDICSFETIQDKLEE